MNIRADISNDLYTRKLRENKLIHSVDLEKFLDQDGEDHHAFLDVVDSPNYPIHHETSSDNWKKMEDITSMHVLKFNGFKLLDALTERGLAKKSFDSNWYMVESYTANLYMAYLAGLIGGNQEVNATPITDKEIDLTPFAPLSYQENYPNIKREETRNIILENILPAPKELLDPKAIVNFKEKNYDKLINFRRELEIEIIKIANINNLESRAGYIDLFKEKTQNNIDDLSQSMKSSGFGKLNLITIGASAAGLGVSIASGEIFTAIISGVGLSRSVKNIYDHKTGKQKSLLTNYLAYAVLLKEESNKNE